MRNKNITEILVKIAKKQDKILKNLIAGNFSDYNFKGEYDPDDDMTFEQHERIRLNKIKDKFIPYSDEEFYAKIEHAKLRDFEPSGNLGPVINNWSYFTEHALTDEQLHFLMNKPKDVKVYNLANNKFLTDIQFDILAKNIVEEYKKTKWDFDYRNLISLPRGKPYKIIVESRTVPYSDEEFHKQYPQSLKAHGVSDNQLEFALNDSKNSVSNCTLLLDDNRYLTPNQFDKLVNFILEKQNGPAWNHEFTILNREVKKSTRFKNKNT